MTESASTSLRSNSIGVSGIVFFVLAFAAPLTVIIGIGPIVLGESGSPGAPAAFLLTTVVLLIFSVGFAAMSREHAGPGGFAVYIGKAFGERSAQAASYIAVVGYNSFLTAGIALFSATTANLLDSRLGIDIPWWAIALVAIIAIGVLGYSEVNVSVRVLGLLLVAEVLIVLVLDVAVFVTGGAEGVNVDGFMPSSLTQGTISVVFLMCFAAFVGFEVTTLFSEEAKDRHRTIPKATYIAVATVGIFYTVSMWAIQLGWGSETAEQATDNPTEFFFTLNTNLVGPWSTDAMQVLVVTSIFAAALSSHGALSRYLLSMGRTGMAPAKLGTTHPRMKSPHIASITQSAITLMLTVIMLMSGADLLSVFYPWIISIGSISILILYVSASVSVLISLRRSAVEQRLWVTTVAPILAAVAMASILTIAILNFDVLTASDSELVNLLWVVPFLAGAVGFAVKFRRVRGETEPVKTA
ncbi:APC family permease [Rhodococcus erythropolis]|uniref:APC family permease n=1 Tax=Rhodococcus erythropolis TaxID=1833 RepID=UPI001BE8CF0D|nr:APC family permease [Rhodococcus erythropolis]MBT2266107.1 APC family permease [Rhodococcus erythropolis]